MFNAITPIPKVCNAKNAEDIRPINQLPTYEKVLEVMVKRRLTDFIEENNILSDVQSGFRKQHSCETAINLVLLNWKNLLEKEKSIVCVFLDLKRAIETIDRKILVEKLTRIGIDGVEKKWFESYLKNRVQRTKIDSTISSPLENDIGVPQGSIMGAFLFVLYINDIEAVIRHSEINLFADDAVIYIAADDITTAVELINNDLNSVAKYFKLNKLKLNINKSKSMLITNKKKKFRKCTNKN